MNLIEALRASDCREAFLKSESVTCYWDSCLGLTFASDMNFKSILRDDWEPVMEGRCNKCGQTLPEGE